MSVSAKVAQVLLCAAVLLSGAACSPSGDSDKEAFAAKFTTDFLNWHYADCMERTAPENHKWISFLASNVSQEDIDLLREAESGVEVEILDGSASDNDTAYTATLAARGFFRPDSIGKPARFVKEARVELKMVNRGGKWLVKDMKLTDN